MEFGKCFICLVYAVKICKIKVNSASPLHVLQPSPFFTEQLTAFEVWLEHGSERKKPPEQLPIVLQVFYRTLPSNRSSAWILVFLDEFHGKIQCYF